MWYHQYSVPLCRGRLICFHHAGGNPHVFGPWADWLAPDIEMITIELPGHGIRTIEPLLTSAEEVARALVPELLPLFTKPLFFLGHSMGAVLAYETVRQLLNVGARPEHLYVIGAYPPCVKHKELLSVQTDDILLQKIVELGGIPSELLADEELLAYFLPILRSDLKMAEVYYSPPSSLPCPTTIFAGKDDIISIEDLAKWRLMNPPTFHMGIYDGGHFFLHENNQVFLGDLRKSLDQQLLYLERQQNKRLDDSS